jgi:cyclic pyranopterin phosphate synthase
MDELSHLDESGAARMVDIGDKPETARRAVAACRVTMAPETLSRIVAGGIPKGDVLALARFAGIAATKRTAELIPLCHPVRVTSASVAIEPAGEDALSITATVSAFDRTGVEMEAMTAAVTAGLTVYDMVKGIDRGVTVTDARLLEKEGGKSGLWTRSGP